jgi:hypothetical protein
MKSRYYILILLSLFTFTLESQTLKENREKRKLSVSLGYNFLTGVGVNGSKAISLDYSITGNFKLGATIQYMDRARFLNNHLTTPLSCYSLTCNEYQKLYPWTGKVYMNYFPFSGSFYLVAAIGKLPDISIETIYTFNPNDINLLILSKPRPAVSNTITTTNNYYANLGFGWRWDFDNGLLFGFDFGLAKEINRKRNLYFYGDARGLVEPNRAPGLNDILFLQNFTYNSSPASNLAYASINLYAGIAF